LELDVREDVAEGPASKSRRPIHIGVGQSVETAEHALMRG
jgi:hypothetical protein